MAKGTKYKIVKFDFVNDFICDGNYCESHCCRNWGIEIDRAAIAKYRNLKDNEFKNELDKKIIYSSERKKHIFILNDDGNCPFLGKDYLCRIQKKYGEEFLSDVCATYPRRYISVSGYLTESLTLTCPVVAHSILTQNQGKINKFNLIW